VSCQTSRYLYESSSIWFIALFEHKKDSILACPPGFNLESTTLPERRRLAYKTAALLRNWASDHPKIRLKKAIPLRIHVEAVCVVPGTSLAVFCSPSLKKLDCYDLQSERLVNSIRWPNHIVWRRRNDRPTVFFYPRSPTEAWWTFLLGSPEHDFRPTYASLTSPLQAIV
jgi:hypothetical protein